MRQLLLGLLCLTPYLTFNCHQANAHYMWVVIGPEQAEPDIARIYFEESPAPGDGHYLNHFSESGQAWFRTVEKIDPRPVTATDVQRDKHRWLELQLPDGAPRSVDYYGKFGVYSYGKTEVLLHYHARFLQVDTHEDLHELRRAEHMRLELVPHDSGDELEVAVRWEGKAVPNRLVYVHGPGKLRKNIKTDAAGRIRIPIETGGRYTFRSSVEFDTPGKDGDREYSVVRHHGTLIMDLPLQK